MAKKQNIISKRFLEILNNLIDEKRVKNLTECSKDIDYPIANLSEVKRGMRNIPVEALHRFIMKYNVSPKYLFSAYDYENEMEVELDSDNEIEGDKTMLINDLIDKLHEDANKIKSLVNNEI